MVAKVVAVAFAAMLAARARTIGDGDDVVFVRQARLLQQHHEDEEVVAREQPVEREARAVQRRLPPATREEEANPEAHGEHSSLIPHS